MKLGTHVLVEQEPPDKVRFTGKLARMPQPLTGLLGVVTEADGQDRIVPSGSKVRRLHVYDDGEIRYVYTCDADGRVWEIIEHRWSWNDELASVAEMKKDFEVLDEEALTERIQEDENDDERCSPPDLTRLGREL